jgi:hypothetical protein
MFNFVVAVVIVNKIDAICKDPPPRWPHRGEWYVLIDNFTSTRGIRNSWV